MITQEVLKELFEYEPILGNLIRRRTVKGNAREGEIFALPSKSPNQKYRKAMIHGTTYMLSKLVWLYHTGYYPTEQLKFINENYHDTRIENLAIRQTANKSKLTQERLHYLLDYDHITGIFTYKNPTSEYCAKFILGKIVGTDNGNGYLTVGLEGTTYKLHRLAWFHYYGVWPKGETDHIDGNKYNNAISNLRDVSKSGNMQNRKVAHKNNQSGLLGVAYHKRDCVYEASIRANGKTLYLGRFHDKYEAHQAYLTAKRKLHKFNTL